jgi:hypothetical protein
MNAGFFKLKRSFFSHWLWDEDRVYNRGEAFLDLLQLAAYSDIKRIVNGKLISVPIGGVAASERYLAERWKWSRTKVRTFLQTLESNRMLKPEKDQGETVLILCNYKRHAGISESEKTSKEPPKNEDCQNDVQNKDHQKTASNHCKAKDCDILDYGKEPAKNQQRTSEGPNKKKVENVKKENNNNAPTQAIAWSDAEGWSGITEDDLSAWREAYPACDIKRQLAVMTEWLKGNPAKAKKSQWRRFLTNWLSRSQDRGGDTKSNLTPHKIQPNMQL